jgi:hypothetical protein
MGQPCSLGIAKPGFFLMMRRSPESMIMSRSRTAANSHPPVRRRHD